MEARSHLPLRDASSSTTNPWGRVEGGGEDYFLLDWLKKHEDFHWLIDWSAHLWGFTCGWGRLSRTRPIMIALPAVFAEDEATAKPSITLHPSAVFRWDKPRPTARWWTHQSSIHQQALFSPELQVPPILRDKATDPRSDIGQVSKARSQQRVQTSLRDKRETGWLLIRIEKTLTWPSPRILKWCSSLMRESTHPTADTSTRYILLHRQKQVFLQSSHMML